MGIKIKDIEKEAIELNRLYNNYAMLRKQHRDSIIEAVNNTPIDDAATMKKLLDIYMLNIKKEEGE